MTEMTPVFEQRGDSRSIAEVCQSIALRPMFWRPAYLETSAWLEHIPFAFWLMETHRPKVFVELGSHYGVSYFAFCQAVDRLGLDTRCFAVDTWKGDEHAGFYEETVFNQVKTHNDANYSGFSRLVRSTFDDALSHFSDGSIDLLHIDGLHTFEAVCHDFEAWLPKLSERGVIVMHDTNVRERNFGVFKLFEELKTKYPTFEFLHGHGLGILGKGPVQSSQLERLFAMESDNLAKPAVQEMFSRLGRACADSLAVSRNHETVQKLKENVARQGQKLDDLKIALDKAKTDFASRTKELVETRGKLQKQAEENAGERAQLAERTALLEQIRVELREDVARLQARIETMELRAVSQAEALAHQQQQFVAEKGGLEKQVAQLSSAIYEMSERNAQHLGQIATLQRQLGEAEAQNSAIDEMSERNAQQLGQIATLQRQLEEAEAQNSVIDEMSERNAQQFGQIATLQRQLEEAETQNASIMQANDEELKLLQHELAEQKDALDQMRVLADQASAEQPQVGEAIGPQQSENAAVVVENSSLPAEEHKPEDSWQREHQQRSQIKALEAEIQRLSKGNAELRMQNQKLTENVDVRFRELAKLTQMLTSANDSLHKQKEKTSELNKKLTASDRTRKDLQQALDQADERTNEALQQLQKKDNDFQQIAQRLAQSAVAQSAVRAPSERFTWLARKLSGQHVAPQAKKLHKEVALLRASGLFDEDWYLTRYPDVQQSKMDPAIHYLRFGAAEGRDPGPWFNTQAYVERYSDVGESNINPLVHYINYGSKEARTIQGIKAE